MAEIGKNVLVTGVNGMLATNIAEQLALAGYHVTGTLRKGRKYRGEGNVAVVEADFKNEEDMKPLVAGSNIVFHVAATTSQSEKDYNVFRKVNVDSTKMLLDLAVLSSVDTFVYVSTANTIGYGGAEGPAMKYPFTESYYAMSKKEAEDIVMDYAGKLRVVVVNPTFMVGKYGSEKGSNRVFSMVKKSPAVFCPPGGKNVLDVSEAARGMILAMEKAPAGSQYLIIGENLSFRELFRRIAGEYRLKRLYIPLPAWLFRLAGKAGDFLARCGVASEVSSATMAMLTMDNFYYTDKAWREIGFKAKRLFEK